MSTLNTIKAAGTLFQDPLSAGDPIALLATDWSGGAGSSEEIKASVIPSIAHDPSPKPPSLSSLSRNASLTNARATLPGFYNDAIALNISATGTYAIGGKQYALDGSGITIGVISSSFDAANMGYAQEIDAGLLPGAARLHVLSDNANSTEDEGRAMAELIHAAAPGATIDFAAADANDPGGAGGDLVAFGQAVTSLANAGCQIIVDDVTQFDASSFQIGSPLDTAIETAIRTKGVSYFSSAGNLGRSYQNLAFIPVNVSQDDGSTQTYAKLNDSLEPYTQKLRVTKDGSITIYLQWNQNFAGYAPVSTTGNDTLQIELYYNVGFGGLIPFVDNNGNPIVSKPLVGEPVSVVTFDPQGASIFYIAVRSLDDGPLPGEFKYFVPNNKVSVDPTNGQVPGQSRGDLIGQTLLPDVNVVGAVDYTNTPAFNAGGTSQLAPEDFSSFGPDVINFGSSGSKNTPPVATPGPEFASVDDGTTGVPGFAPFKGTSAAAPNAAAVAALMLQANPNLTPAQITQLLQKSAIALPDSGDPTNPNYKYQVGAGLIQADKAVALAIAAAACFAAGTRILTARGEVPVEQLRSGDIVVTRFGRLRPIIWVGRRDIDVSRQPNPHLVHPVRIAAGALGLGQPHRNLFVSREHAILVGDVLVPARCLVNGTSIRQVPVDHVSYFHIELAAHDLLIVEGLLAESWLDTGNRAMFQNAAVATLLADLSGERRDPGVGRTCVPMVEDGPILAVIRADLAARQTPSSRRTCKAAESASAVRS